MNDLVKVSDATLTSLILKNNVKVKKAIADGSVDANKYLLKNLAKTKIDRPWYMFW
jgi:hypothetical protein